MGHESMSEHKLGPSTISVPTKKQRSKQKVYRVRFPLFFDETPASLRLITRDKKFLIFKPQIRERERERERCLGKSEELRLRHWTAWS